MNRLKIRLNSMVYIGLLFAALSLFIWFLIPHQIQILEESSRVDAQTFPKIVSVLMFLLSIVLIIQGFLTTKTKKESSQSNRKKELRTIIIMGIFLLYASTIELLGFLPSSIILCVVLLAINKVMNWKYYVSVIVIVFSIFIVFEHLLSLNLP